MKHYKTCITCDVGHPEKSRYPLYYKYCPNCTNELIAYEVIEQKKPKKYFKIPVDKITNYSMSATYDSDLFGPKLRPTEYIHQIEVTSLDTKMKFNKNNKDFDLYNTKIVNHIQI